MPKTSLFQLALNASTIFLLLWTIIECLQLISFLLSQIKGNVNVCLAHRRLLRNLGHRVHSIGFKRETGLSLELQAFISEAEFSSHDRLRLASSEFLRVSDILTGRHLCSKQQYHYDFEWSLLGRYPLDGVLLNIFSLIGSQSRFAVEIDDAHGMGVLSASSSLVLLHGWSGVSIHSTWSGQNTAKTLFESRRKNAPVYLQYGSVYEAIEASTEPSSIVKELELRGLGKEIDLLLLFVENGQEKGILEGMNAFKPRVLVMFYRDFWGSETPIARTANSSVKSSRRGMQDPLRVIPHAGSNLEDTAALAKMHSYRLIWCLRNAPIAVFVKEDAIEADRLLPTISKQKCIAARQSDPSYRKDMEALWDATHRD